MTVFSFLEEILDFEEFYENEELLESPNQRKFFTNHVEAFFVNRPFHCGGKIPRSFLRDPQRIDRVFNMTIVEAVDIIYKTTSRLVRDGQACRYSSNGDVSWDIKLVNESLKLIASSGVPQEFAGGILLMYLELCEGIFE